MSMHARAHVPHPGDKSHTAFASKSSTMPEIVWPHDTTEAACCIIEFLPSATMARVRRSWPYLPPKCMAENSMAGFPVLCTWGRLWTLPRFRATSNETSAISRLSLPNVTFLPNRGVGVYTTQSRSSDGPTQAATPIPNGMCGSFHHK